MQREEIANRLQDFILNELIHDPDIKIDETTPIISSGLINSFSIVEIGLFIETEFNVYIPDAELTVKNMDTIEKITIRIQKDL